MKPPTSEKQTPHWKVKPPSGKRFLEKIPQKSETVINTYVSIIKQHRKKMAGIPQESDFVTWSIQKFVRNVKQFVKKYITWLISQLVVIDIAPLMVLFCNCPMLKNISFNNKLYDRKFLDFLILRHLLLKCLKCIKIL